MSYSEVDCFWSEEAPLARESMRRYGGVCPGGVFSAHNAEVVLGNILMPLDQMGMRDSVNVDKADLRWPTKCSHCAYVFTDEDAWQHNRVRLYAGGGHLFVLNEAPPGAMWNADWYSHHPGPDGMHLVVRLPNGRDWLIDSRASNCTIPEDSVHRCWVRHGDPRTQPITVDKKGVTCNAGAGSIQAGDYHGFLRNGRLVVA